MDSHADQVCVGDGAAILYVYPDRQVNVGPFLDKLGSVDSAPIVMALIAYDDPSTGRAKLIVAHQAIQIKGLKNNILCPMQLRHNGLTVNERPKHCTPIPTREDHAIVFPDGYLIPLSLAGITSYFPTRKPTKDEVDSYKNGNGDYLELTAESPEWDPHSVLFSELEDSMVDRYGDIVKQGQHPRQLFMMVTDDHFHNPFRKLAITTTTQKPGHETVTQLSANWGIGREAAERTLRATTRRGAKGFDGTRTTAERRFPTGDRPLRYRRLGHALYHDTLFSTVRSYRGNTCSEVYATDFGWSRNFPMKRKSEAHHTLDDLFHRYGVPTKLISDGAKELTLGKLAKRLERHNAPWNRRSHIALGRIAPRRKSVN